MAKARESRALEVAVVSRVRLREREREGGGGETERECVCVYARARTACFKRRVFVSMPARVTVSGGGRADGQCADPTQYRSIERRKGTGSVQTLHSIDL